MNNRRLYIVSRMVSALFNPFITPLVIFIMLLFFTYLRILPLAFKLIILSMVTSFTMVLPMLTIYIFQRINGWRLKDLRVRERRFFPYGLTILCYVTCLITMNRMHLSRYLWGIILAALLCMVICTLINLKWKISTHTASSGLFIGVLLSYSLIFNFNPVWWLCVCILLAGLIGSARIIVRQHTLNEVCAGFFVGIFCGIIGILFI